MQQQIRTIAFIGAGNMTQSIVGGMVKAGYPAKQIIVTNPSPGKLQSLAERYGVQISQDNAAAAAAEVVVLAVKPQLMAAVCADLRDRLDDVAGKLWVSIAAGVRLNTYRQYLAQADLALVRVMPNTPSLVGAGMTGLVTDARTSQADADFVSAMFASIGKVQWVQDEPQLDILAAVAGSGPAYFFEFMASLQQAAVALGYDPEQARLLVNQTALGAALMAAESPLELAELRQQVTSKGGSTAKGIEVYQAADLNFISEQAVAAAVKRNGEMAAQF